MTMSDEHDPGEWVDRWLHSETFWQNIVIQTVGTLLAALIIALLAIFTGIGYTPAIRFYVVTGILLVGSFVGYVWLTSIITKKMNGDKPQTRVRLGRTLLFGLVAWGLAELVYLGRIPILNLIARLTGYSQL